MKALWKSRESEAIEKGLALPAPELPGVIQRFLRARGVMTAGDLQKLTAPKLSELKDPTALRGMREAMGRLLRAYENRESVCIYADFDLDGSSGLGLLYRGMYALGYESLSYYQPKRLSEGYGFHASAVEELHQRGVRLIVTVDVGITALAACARARELGVDVIITDHHQPGKTLPDALTVINPNQSDCASELNYLCGAGVAFYLLRGLKRALTDRGIARASELDLRDSLDLLGIGTLTDMVPLQGDNRALVKAGIQGLARTKKAGLRRLLEELDLDKESLTSQEVAIRFSPKLNALSRMEAGILPIDIFLAEDEARADELVTRMMGFNADRVQHQQQGEKIAFELLEGWAHEGFAFVFSDQFHRGVIGLLATKIVNTLGVPAFVGAVGDDGQIVGSGRWPAGVPGSLLTAMEAAKLALTRFGGHHAAAGFELPRAKAEEFTGLLARHFSELAAGAATGALPIVYDIDLDWSEITEPTMKWLEAFEPYGVGFPQPLFRVTDLQIREVLTLRGGHLKWFFKAPGSAKKLEALWFSPPPVAQELAARKDAVVEIIGELQRNTFAGQKTIQILIKDMRPSPATERAPELTL